MPKHWSHPLAAGLAVILLFGGCVSDQIPASDRKEAVISHHTFRGVLTGFEIGDYVHPIIQDPAGKERTFFVLPNGLSYYLALHKGEVLEFAYAVVDSFIEEAGGVVRIERLVSATDGRLSSQQWWQTERRAHSVEQLRAKYEPLVGKYTIDRYAAELPTALEILQGTWRITDKNHCPHICAMKAEEAGRFTGTILRYSAAHFSNGRVSCESPRFSRREWTGPEFLKEYRFKPEILGLKPPLVEELSVTCGDSRASWPQFGATVLVRDRRTILVAWDGVFFEARRE
jgi:hypothetical protein